MPLDDALVDEAVEQLEEILNQIAVGYPNMTAEELVDCVREIRTRVEAARTILTTGQSLRVR